MRKLQIICNKFAQTMQNLRLTKVSLQHNKLIINILSSNKKRRKIIYLPKVQNCAGSAIFVIQPIWWRYKGSGAFFAYARFFVYHHQ
ncbi:hypothetical protein [Chitinophaga qingshengii]|uniref:Uncharacterized protein n=1 Tax=Chitinophaga qingshengii TaxID=1569794 RepID=A0ABR7TUP1_9BACT|nr:hypothetical protein [Chitinophaga qingshengii]MBC9934201.1 hypothetical protein [Chitinophaga qingshengii]